MSEQKIFVGQTALRLELATLLDSADIKSAKIKYKKPLGETGEWDAVVDDNGIIYKDDFQTSDLDQAGTWIFWPRVVNQADQVAFGDGAHQRIYEEAA
jgi:hypothetical protein